MATTAEVVIVGGGMAGASTAYHLAARGVKNIVVIEKENVASGATGRSGAMLSPLLRDTPELMSLALKSIRIYRDWSEQIGDCGFRQTGGLVILDPEEQEWTQDTVQTAQGVGLTLEVISPEDVKTVDPSLRVDDIGGAIFCRDAGHGDGYSAANAFMAKARELGVQLMRFAHVTDIEVQKGRVTGVRTITGDRVSAPTVVLAAGAWSGPLARTAGVELPVTPRRVCAGILQRPPEIPKHMTIGRDRTIGTYWRMEGPDQTLLGIRNREVMPTCDPDNYPQTVSEETRSMWARRLIHRMPAMASAGWRLIWTAPELYTPDHHPMLGAAPDVKGLFLALAFSGGGFMLGPIAGKCLAELIADGKAHSGDIHTMRPSRFQEGKPNHIPTEDEWPYPTRIDRRFP